jgi:CheY-like chemotaxis protein
MARPEDAVQAKVAGFDVHVAKPFEAAQLIEVMAALIQQQRE